MSEITENPRNKVQQTRGPTIVFRGVLIAEDDFTTGGPDSWRVRIEVWQTDGGGYVAINTTEPANRDGYEVVRAIAVEKQDDARAMRFEVMDFFEWDNRARSMMRKQAKWNLNWEIA